MCSKGEYDGEYKGEPKRESDSRQHEAREQCGLYTSFQLPCKSHSHTLPLHDLHCPDLTYFQPYVTLFYPYMTYRCSASSMSAMRLS